MFQMTKKCIICDDKATYAIKNTKDYYCEECACEQFGDISYLISIDEALKQQKEASFDDIQEELLKEE